MAAARMAEVWAWQSPAEAMTWVKTLSNEDRLRAGAAAIIVWTETDAVGAVEDLVRRAWVEDGGSKHPAPGLPRDHAPIGL